ncbi:DUF2236 domain-containing protein [Nocardia otitidiscaviarum]|uniref:oxygenase MpaB family protein n=1 Tax=Nocardia otitidiscaviarum TaxID=1823 RepID=UPI001892E3A2|nr:oxygenase MpaB family protein [Nocardia otitidiscaviarum]MBF6241468.1 DUF2236 domain-containing protein [Nocardia otitidiscaviarum]
MGRYDRLRIIERLTPERDFELIHRLDAQFEFPVEIAIGSELAQIHTFAIPTIGDLLGRTGEFEQRPHKRADDTALLLTEVLAHGIASDRGRRAVRRINRAHAPYPISQEDFRYVLATFVVVAARFVDAHGWRPMSPTERTALYLYYRHLGEHMAIKDIPGSYEDMADYLDSYEARFADYSDGGHRVALANRDRLAADLLPRLPLRISRAVVDALTPDHIRRALALPDPGRATRAAVTAVLRTRAAVLRRWPGSAQGVGLFDFPWRRSYPDGYDIDHLGPALTATGDCPVVHPLGTGERQPR